MARIRVDNLGKSSVPSEIKFEDLVGQVVFRSVRTFRWSSLAPWSLLRIPVRQPCGGRRPLATLWLTAAVQRELRLLHLFPLRSLTFCGHGRRLYHTGRASSLVRYFCKYLYKRRKALETKKGRTGWETVEQKRREGIPCTYYSNFQGM